MVSLPDSVFANLGQLATVLNEQPELHIRIEIHAQDKWGEEEAAQRLAALEETVTSYLVDQGIDGGRITVEAKGMTGSDWIDIIVTETGE